MERGSKSERIARIRAARGTARGGWWTLYMQLCHTSDPVRQTSTFHASGAHDIVRQPACGCLVDTFDAASMVGQGGSVLGSAADATFRMCT